ITLRQRPTSTLFPYTTLFRSSENGLVLLYRARGRQEAILEPRGRRRGSWETTGDPGARGGPSSERRFAGHHRRHRVPHPGRTRRSEEHTSELQSRFDLVCRLL